MEQTNIVTPLHHAVQHVARYGKITRDGPYAVVAFSLLAADALSVTGNPWTLQDVARAAGRGAVNGYRFDLRAAGGDHVDLVDQVVDYADRVQDIGLPIFCGQIDLRQSGRAELADRLSVHWRQWYRRYGMPTSDFDSGLSRLQIARRMGVTLRDVNAEYIRRRLDPLVLPLLPVAEIRLARHLGNDDAKIADHLELERRDMRRARNLAGYAQGETAVTTRRAPVAGGVVAEIVRRRAAGEFISIGGGGA